MYKLKDEVELKELEKYGFHTFTDWEGVLHAVRDSRDDRCHSWQYYRTGINANDRTFHKSKFRGCGKCLLSMTATRNDLSDLIQANLIERC